MARSKGKWSKHTAMYMNPQLRPVLPHTELLNQKNFYRLLKMYRHIIVKPSNSSGGDGVIQITTIAPNQFKVHYEKKQKKVNLEQLYPLIRRLTPNSKATYIVQRRISLLKINGKPFDLRVMVQRKKGVGWLVTGIMAKVAGSGYFITNLVRSKGKALPYHTALRQCNRAKMLSPNCWNSKFAGMPSWLSNNFRNITKSGRLAWIWESMNPASFGIIEANFSPDKTYFKRLKDKTMYRRIMAIYNKH